MSAKNRQELLDEIAAYHPFNEQEERDKNLIFQWIEQHEDAFSRENTVAHVTASAWMVNKDRSKVLMVYLTFTIPGPGWAAMQMVRQICYQWPFVR